VHIADFARIETGNQERMTHFQIT